MFRGESAEKYGSDNDSIGGHLAFKKRITKPKIDGIDDNIKSSAKKGKLNERSLSNNQLNLSN